MDATTDPARTSWIETPPHSDFPIQNLPYGAFERDGTTHLGVAIGERILDLHSLAESGLCDDVCDRNMLVAENLNVLLAAGREAWASLRGRISDLLRVDGDSNLRESNVDRIFVDRAGAQMRVPVQIGDYVDFYSSLEHATNLGKIFRPDGEPLMPNWRWMPIGYHGRSATIVIDGTPIARPNGQRKPPNAATPTFGPSQSLDIELEVGFITGSANRLGAAIPASRAREHIFGLVLVNDWSARDIQAWEYQPLGPFLGKSFATTISPWVVTLDALEPFRVAGPTQEPEPLEYLRMSDAWGYDISLEVQLSTERTRAERVLSPTISRTNFKYMYWNMAQQLAHATVNGAIARPGDLFASGTISGPTRDSLGSLIELTWRGTKPLALPDGETRAFLENGDEITLHGRCEKAGARGIGFGCARGRIVASAG